MKSTRKIKYDARDIESLWDKKIFIRTIFACGLISAALLMWIEYVKPPEGYVFERLPTVTGPWWSGRCEHGYFYTCARVGSLSVSCSMGSYYPWEGGSRGACGALKIPNDEVVNVVLVKTPIINNSYHEYVATIYSNSRVYQTKDDKELRELWIREARRGVESTFSLMFMISYIFQLARREYVKE